MKSNVCELLYLPTVRWAARRTLVGRNRRRQRPAEGRCTRQDVDRLIARAWSRFDERVADLPEAGTVGNRMNLRLACLSLSLLETLLDTGIEREYAIELFADAAWRIYEKWAVVPRALTRLLTRDAVERLRLRLRMFLRFPFSPPGYRYQVTPLQDGLAIDIHRCPIAEYLGAHGAADLCVGAWCDLDYALAEMWGGRLERSTTLAGGGTRCDFRCRTGGTGPAGTAGGSHA
jgi:ubiquinone biosynthesis protein